MAENAKITSFFGKSAGNKNESKKHIELVPTRLQLPKDAPKGLIVVENYINSASQDQLLKDINNQEWSNLLKRRVQHYGYEYSYQQRTASKRLGDLPDFTSELTKRLVNDGYFSKQPDQLIINEYIPGQGIASHIDARVFGDTIVSLSLGSACMFTFQFGTETFELYLRPGTLVVMTGDSRYKWSHCIIPKKTDVDPETQKVVPRGTRVSLTFRQMAK